MANDRRISRILLGAFIGIIGSIASVSAANAWGPERTTYTNESPAPKAVFNSITNNAAVGDERDFVRIVEVNEDGSKGVYANEIHVSPGKTYEVYIYYHNDASGTYNTKEYNYVGVARDTKVSSSFPESIKKGESADVYAAITSSTTSVPKVWDIATLVADEDVVFAYISGTAKLYNDQPTNNTTLSTNLFTDEGTFIGVTKTEDGKPLTGTIPGCDEYSGQVVYRIKTLTPEEPTPPTPPEPEKKPGYEITKNIRVEGSDEWGTSAVVQPNDTVEYRVTFKNTGEVTEKEVKMYDALDSAKGMKYVDGSLAVTRTKGDETTSIDPDAGFFGDNGMLIGEVEPGETITAIYKVKFTGENNEECKITSLYNNAHVSGKVEGDDDVTVVYDLIEVKVDRTDGDCSSTPTPPTPSRIPETGPVEIVMAIVVVLGICGGGFYLYRTRKTLKTAEDAAVGKDATTAAPQQDATATKEEEPKEINKDAK